MAKVHSLTDTSNTHAGYLAFCPGCEFGHLFDARWSFNKDFEKPTFSPSMLVNQHDLSKRCHSFLRDGKWQFLDDCFHSLKGQTVEMIDLDE
jgi:hypothetical protein